MIRRYIIYIFLLSSVLSFAQNTEKKAPYKNTAEQESDITKWTPNRPDGHTPMGVIGDHTHFKGEIMFSFQTIDVEINSLQTDNKKINATHVFAMGYPTSPENMEVKNKVFTVMYAPTNKLTLMLTGAYLQKFMKLESNPTFVASLGYDTTFTTKSSGFSDVKLVGLYQLRNKFKKTFHLNLGVSIPTGSISATQNISIATTNPEKLNYSMQLGSGSFDPIIGATYLVQKAHWSYGVQSINTLRLFNNSENYKASSEFYATTWASLKLSELISISLRADETIKTKIVGKDSAIDATKNPLNDTANSESTKTRVFFGMNGYLFGGNLRGLRLGFEIGGPVFQNIKGTQLAGSGNVIGGLQYTF